MVERGTDVRCDKPVVDVEFRCYIMCLCVYIGDNRSMCVEGIVKRGTDFSCQC